MGGLPLRGQHSWSGTLTSGIVTRPRVQGVVILCNYTSLMSLQSCVEGKYLTFPVQGHYIKPGGGSCHSQTSDSLLPEHDVGSWGGLSIPCYQRRLSRAHHPHCPLRAVPLTLSADPCLTATSTDIEIPTWHPSVRSRCSSICMLAPHLSVYSMSVFLCLSAPCQSAACVSAPSLCVCPLSVCSLSVCPLCVWPLSVCSLLVCSLYDWPCLSAQPLPCALRGQGCLLASWCSWRCLGLSQPNFRAEGTDIPSAWDTENGAQKLCQAPLNPNPLSLLPWHLTR